VEIAERQTKKSEILVKKMVKKFEEKGVM